MSKVHHTKSSVGYVYVLSNECMPYTLKIGMTTTSPEQRCSELSSSTGVPTPFILEEAYLTTNPYQVERAVHKLIGKYRVNKGREFFKIDFWDALDAIEKVLRDSGREINRTVGRNEKVGHCVEKPVPLSLGNEKSTIPVFSEPKSDVKVIEVRSRFKNSGVGFLSAASVLGAVAGIAIAMSLDVTSLIVDGFTYA